VHNLTDYNVTAGPYAIAGTAPEVLFADSNVGALSGTASGWQANLPPRATGIWRLKP
jgi:hypothetical protein